MKDKISSNFDNPYYIHNIICIFCWGLSRLSLFEFDP